MAAKINTKEEAIPGTILLVVHNFVARSADELSLAKGDRVELIEKDDDFGDGWFLGRHMVNGNTGLFPEVYTTPAPKGTLNNTITLARRASDSVPNLPQGNSGSAPTPSSQQRHSSTSTSATSTRPVSGSSTQQTAQSPMTQATLRTSISSTTSGTKGNAVHADSPVMSETLSVIDEHMNDMGASRTASFKNGARREMLTSSVGSAYSQSPNRFSYIAGHETDEEEHQFHSEEEVMSWNPERVAEYLEDHGVEKAHCDVFKEQEISGEVLLAMDQGSLFIKELELGPVGRRLKTWHKIKALQDEVKHTSNTEVQKNSSEDAGLMDDNNSDAQRTRASTVGSALPRALSTSSRPADIQATNSTAQSISQQINAPTTTVRSSGMSPLQPMTSMSRPENVSRPSAQTIRALQNSRRHSSIDSTANSVDSNGRSGNRKQPSIDKKWQPGQPQANGRTRQGHSHSQSSESAMAARDLNSTLTSSPGELDRGYFSSSEIGDTSSRATKTRNILTKKGSSATVSPMHSRPSSFINLTGRRNTQPGRATTSNSSHDAASVTDNPSSSEGVWGAMNIVSNKLTGLRSVTLPQLPSKPVIATSDDVNPVVTKLDYDGDRAVASTASPAGEDGETPTSPSGRKIPFFSAQKAKFAGLRTISDAVTRDEKMTASPVKESKESPATHGSVSPSTETTSIDLQKSEAQSRTSQGSAVNLVSNTPGVRRPRAKTKTKKTTSAYTRGLEKKKPTEQMAGCDYSGWMKKKSGSLMTTWKTRLFILRGRRLSYYYSDDDTEEKGLIDISFHRVLPAMNEMLTGIHASLTGAGASPTSPRETLTETAAEQDLKTIPPKAGETEEGLFIFKLVPPKTGLSKAVNFTKPTVHYFAVNSRQEGRLWMAALMKATIDRDDDGIVTTTYNQKTISLAKAQARKERPPALREDGTTVPTADVAELDGEAGLGIEGLDEQENTAAGAEKEAQERSFLTLSTGTDGEPVNEKDGGNTHG